MLILWDTISLCMWNPVSNINLFVFQSREGKVWCLGKTNFSVNEGASGLSPNDQEGPWAALPHSGELRLLTLSWTVQKVPALTLTFLSRVENVNVHLQRLVLTGILFCVCVCSQVSTVFHTDMVFLIEDWIEGKKFWTPTILHVDGLCPVIFSGPLIPMVELC